MTTADLTPILQRLDAIAAQVAYIADRQRQQEELVAEMMPIARAAMATAIERLDGLDRQGYFAFASELAGVAGKIVESFTPQDVRALGDATVGILETIRAMTQPEVLAVAADAAAALQSPEQVKKLGLFKAMRATKDDDVQIGLGLMVEMLRRVGKGVTTMAARHEGKQDRKAKLAQLLGPRRDKKLLGTERPRLPAAPACAAPARPAVTAAIVDGVGFTADGHLADAATWTRPLAESLARGLAVALTSDHWAVIEAARADFAASQVSPNIRRLTQLTNLATKDLYTLFPRAPGRTIAKIAGLPKPAGCL